MRTYVIADSSDVGNFDFSQLVDIDESYSRKSLDGSKILARFEGESTPSFLAGLTQYNHSEILPIMYNSEWFYSDPI
jgi:hypothetical protein